MDDAMALAYAIARPEVELVGITTCFGNVRVDQSAHNCLAVLDLLGRPEVPGVPAPTVLCRRLSLIRRRRPPRSFTVRTASAARACPRRPTSRWGDIG
ncbi:MAG: nucleoside hydrolase [Collinsella sp.]